MGEGIQTIGRAARKTDRSYLHDTESGMNRQEAFKVSQLEAKIRNRKTEKGYVVGSNGEIIAESVSGNASSARFLTRDLAKTKDAILTHNHPTEGANSGLHGTMAGRIGVPFSPQDIRNAVKYDQKEVRAVTPTYTYSIRRPKGGWGDKQKIFSELNALDATYSGKMNVYAFRTAANAKRQGNLTRQRAQEISDRANVGIQFSAIKKFAKDNGITFTRRKIK